MSGYDAELQEIYDNAKENPLNQMIYKTWLHHLGSVEGLEVLEPACGSGYGSRMLAERGAKVTAFDLSKDMLTVAEKEEEKNPLGITYFQSDMVEVNLGKQFDVVAPSFLYHYAPSVEALRKFVQVTAKHLKPGGKLVALHAGQEPIIPKVVNRPCFTTWIDKSTAFEDEAPLRLHILSETGEVVGHFDYFYYSTETYKKVFGEFGFEEVAWHKHKMPEELKARYENWQDIIDHNASCVLTASLPG